jgi:hypothetical protein
LYRKPDAFVLHELVLVSELDSRRSFVRIESLEVCSIFVIALAIFGDPGSITRLQAGHVQLTMDFRAHRDLVLASYSPCPKGVRVGQNEGDRLQLREVEDCIVDGETEPDCEMFHLIGNIQAADARKSITGVAARSPISRSPEDIVVGREEDRSGSLASTPLIDEAQLVDGVGCMTSRKCGIGFAVVLFKKLSSGLSARMKDTWNLASIMDISEANAGSEA